ncbi:MAG TPA: hypothetical protein VNN79_19050 [Actinomycetota bacterium]|nr:hypothetical protein [Actinomycetota bacterium]
MPAVPDLSAYLVSNGETPPNPTKFNNLVNAIQDSLNNVGNPAKTTWSPGQILGPSQLSQGGAATRQGLIWNGSSWVPAGIGALAVRTVTSTVDVQNTTTETDLLTGTTGSGYLTIPANSLVALGGIRLVIGGDYLNNTGSNRTIRLKVRVGTAVALPAFTTWTPLWDSDVSDVISSNANRRAWELELDLQALNSTASQNCGGLFEMSATTAPTTGLGPLAAASSSAILAPFTGAATAVDYTNDTGIVFTVIHSFASASLSMRVLHARLEVSSS